MGRKNPPRHGGCFFVFLFHPTQAHAMLDERLLFALREQRAGRLPRISPGYIHAGHSGTMGECNTMTARVCPGWGIRRSPKWTRFLPPTRAKSADPIGDGQSGDGVTGGQSTWDTEHGPGRIDTFVQNIANVVNQQANSNGGFERRGY